MIVVLSTQAVNNSSLSTRAVNDSSFKYTGCQ